MSERVRMALLAIGLALVVVGAINDSFVTMALGLVVIALNVQSGS